MKKICTKISFTSKNSKKKIQNSYLFFIVVLAQKVVNIGFDQGKEIITYFFEFLFKFSFFQPESFCYDQNENILWFS